MEINAKEVNTEETSMDVDIATQTVDEELTVAFDWTPYSGLKSFFDRERQSYLINEDIFVAFLSEAMRRDGSIRDDHSLQHWIRQRREEWTTIPCSVATSTQQAVDITCLIFLFSKQTLLRKRRISSKSTICIALKPQSERLLIYSDYKRVKYDVLKHFVTFVKTCVREFHQTMFWIPINGYKGPFTSLIQSSGMGKTRLALECATEENMHVLYICFRNQGSSGYPPRTECIVDYIMHANGQGLTEWFWNNLFTAMLWCYSKSVLSDTKEARVEWLKGVATNDEGIFFWDDVKRVCELLMNGLPVLMDNEERLSLKEVIKTLPKEDYFLVVFDEAVVLAEQQESAAVEATMTTTAAAISREAVSGTDDSMLNCIRKTLRNLGNGNCNIFGLFVDTMPNIHNLYPAERPTIMTPSYLGDDEPKLVFPAFYMLPLCNLPTPENMGIISLPYDVGDGHHVMVRYHPLRIALLSRALFAMNVLDTYKMGMCDTEERETSYIRARVSLAMEQLMCEKGEFRKVQSSPSVSDDDILAKLAVLSVKFCLSSTSVMYRQLLIRQHMATCFGTGEDGEIIARYQSEPFLAEAATQTLLMPNVFNKCLQELYNLSVRGTLTLPSDEGEMGELVACIALSRAFDKTCHRLGTGASPLITSVNCRPVPLVEVLVELYGTKNKEKVLDMLKDNALRTGVVMFNHFIKLRSSVTSVGGYKQLLKGATAVLCPSGETAIDIIIPVALPVQADVEIDLWDFESYTLTLWEVQVKNWKSPFNLEKLVYGMAKTYPLDEMEPHFLTKVTRVDDASTEDQSMPVYSVPILYMAINIGCNRSTNKLDDDSIGCIFEFDRQWGLKQQPAESRMVSGGDVGFDDEGGQGRKQQKRKRAASASMVVPVKETAVGMKSAAVAANTRQVKGASVSNVGPVKETAIGMKSAAVAANTRQVKGASASMVVPVKETTVGMKGTGVASNTRQAKAASVSKVGVALESKQEYLDRIKASSSDKLPSKCFRVSGFELCGVKNMAVFDESERPLVEQLLRPMDETAPLRQQLTEYCNLKKEEVTEQVESLEPYNSQVDEV